MGHFWQELVNATIRRAFTTVILATKRRKKEVLHTKHTAGAVLTDQQLPIVSNQMKISAQRGTLLKLVFQYTFPIGWAQI